MNGFGSGIQRIIPGSNITVDETDPLLPVISSSGGGTANGRLPIADSQFVYSFSPNICTDAAPAAAPLSGNVNSPRAIRVSIPVDCNLSAWIYVATAGSAGGEMNAALYAADPVTGYPGSLAYDLGNINLTATGAGVTSGTDVVAGDYWLFFNVNTAGGTGSGRSLSNAYVDGEMPLAVANFASLTAAQVYSLSASLAYTSAAPSSLSGITWIIAPSATKGYVVFFRVNSL